MSYHRKVSYSFLFLRFLKIGSIAFGGFMALISIVQRELVDKEKIVKNSDILDAISLATVLPGPIAVNVVTFIGYRLRGIKGGLISMLAVVLPSFFLILGLSYVYFRYGNITHFQNFFDGVVPAVAAIILTVAINMTRKNINDYRQYILGILAFFLLVYIGGFFITLLLVVSGGVIGYLLFRRHVDATPADLTTAVSPWKEIIVGISKNKFWMLGFALVLAGLTLAAVLPGSFLNDELKKLNDLFLTFSMVSVTLFGGGYVFIPMLQELVVTNLGWLTDQEFIDGIAMGQITPGPIMISATFIGYKFAGLPGAVLATIGMFLPPGLLIMMCSGFIDFFRNSPVLKAIFKGIHAVVIGMIYAACFILIASMPHDWLQLIIFVLSFVLTFWLKVDILIIIPLAGLASVLFGSV